jgi:hypothetical protein
VLSILQLGLDDRLQLVWGGDARPTLLDLAIFPDEEFLKVPLDPLKTHETGLALLHPFPDGLGFRAVDVGLAQNREGNTVVELTEGLDVVVVARVLVTELVAGEADDLEVGVVGLEFYR